MLHFFKRKSDDNLPKAEFDEELLSPTFHVREQNPSRYWGFARERGKSG